jgi:hypothetical protein
VVDLQPRVVSSESLRFSCTSDAQKESHRDHEDTERIRVALDAIPCQKLGLRSELGRRSGREREASVFAGLNRDALTMLSVIDFGAHYEGRTVNA